MTQTLQTWFSILFEGVLNNDNLDKSLEMIEYSEIQTNETPFEGKSLGDKMLGAELEGGVAPLRSSIHPLLVDAVKRESGFRSSPLSTNDQAETINDARQSVSSTSHHTYHIWEVQDLNLNSKIEIESVFNQSQCLLVHEPYLDNGCIFPSMIIMILCFEKSWRCYVDVKKEVNLMTIM